MKTLTATLMTDGSSDRVLLPLIQFLLDEHSPLPHRTYFAEGLHSGSLTSRLPAAMASFPCDLLFVHRDAESDSVAQREREIDEAMRLLNQPPHAIRIIPVRMTESWLLTDERAIRRAAGNPNGQDGLQLPAWDRLEALPDPKKVLFDALATAKSVGARRRAALRPEALRHRVSELIEDFALLRKLTSFQHFERQVAHFFQHQG